MSAKTWTLVGRLPACPRRQSSVRQTLLWMAAAAASLTLLTGLFALMVFSDVFHDYEHRRLRTVAPAATLSPEKFTDQLQSYFLSSGTGLLQNRRLSYREKLHYREVRQVMRAGVAGFFCFAAVAAALFVWIYIATGRRHGSLRKLAEPVLRRTGLLLLATIGVCGVLSLNFDTSFFKLHRLIFDGNNWVLPPSSLTIQMFPARYFFDFLITYAALVAGFALLSLGGSAICRRQ